METAPPPPSPSFNYLAGQIAIVTGGGSGIGYAIAEQLHRAGCRVMICGRDETKLQAALQRLGGASPTAQAHVVDVTCETSVQSLFAVVDREWGSVGILVNNAGAFDGGHFPDLSLETWNKVTNACLTGTFLCSREAFRRMAPLHRGRILNIGSISAQRPRSGSAPYSAAKFGVWGLTQAIALDGRAHGIVCSCLHPGNVMVERRLGTLNVSDDEPMIDAQTMASAALAMLNLPPDVNFLEAIVLPRDQEYLARG